MVGVKGRLDPNKKEVICECGLLVRGISKEHLKANLKLHKKSKLHKQLILNRKVLKKK